MSLSVSLQKPPEMPDPHLWPVWISACRRQLSLSAVLLWQRGFSRIPPPQARLLCWGGSGSVWCHLIGTKTVHRISQRQLRHLPRSSGGRTIEVPLQEAAGQSPSTTARDRRGDRLLELAKKPMRHLRRACYQNLQASLQSPGDALKSKAALMRACA